MQSGTAGPTLTSDTDIDSLSSLELASDPQNSASEIRCGSTLTLCVTYSKTTTITYFSLSEYVVVGHLLTPFSTLST